MDDKLYTINGGCEYLGGISPWTLRSYLSQGLIRRTKVGGRTMVRESELKRLIRDETPRDAAARNSARERRRAK